MINRLTSLWNDWKNTAIGKAVEDFFWNVLFTSVFAGLTAAGQALVAGQTDIKAIATIFSTGVGVSFLKALSVFRDKYKNPLVPNSPLP